jgi:Ni/Co efflux regulator RcnB
MKRITTIVAAAVAIAVASAAPAAAQGKSGQHGGGQGGAHGRGHVEQGVTHGSGNGSHGRAATDVRVNRTTRTTTVRGTTRSVPPGWCQGRGNPHNTAVNCGYRTDRIYRDRNGVWRDRYGNRLASGFVYRDRTGTVRDWLGRILR